MIIMTLDVAGTHENNPDCPMRLVQTPKGEWMCADCGMHILWKRLRVKEVKDDEHDPR